MHLYDVSDAIYKFKPELKPEYLKDEPYDEAELESFSKIMYEAESLRDNCEIQSAIELLAKYVSEKPSKHYLTLTEKRIEYYKSKSHT